MVIIMNPTNILYVSDLDGTLLTPSKQISEESVSILNRLLAQGMLFTVATARSAATAAEILAPLHLSLPGVLLNGALLYDFKQKRYIDCAAITPKAAKQVLDVFRRNHRLPFMYLLEEDTICVEFEQLANTAEYAFYMERKDKAYKRFQQVESLRIVPGSKIVYFTMMDNKDRLLPMYEQLQNVEGIRTAFYKDNYTDVFYLEVFSFAASKSAGMQRLQKLCGAAYVTAFGDNLNDLDMLHAADEGLVVADGVTEVKTVADGIIGSSYADGVAHYLEEAFCRQK